MKVFERLEKKVGILPMILALISFGLSFIFEKALVSTSSLLADILRGAVVAVITYLIAANVEALQKLQSHLTETDINKIADIRNHIEKGFLEIFDEYFDSVLHNINSAVKHKKITIYTVEQFSDFYLRVLKKCPDTTFYATSLVNKNYFWRDTIEKGSVEYATQEFTKGKGKFTRIFFVTDADKHDTEHLRKLIETQKKMGVDVFCLDPDALGLDQRKFKKFILVTENQKFAWEVHVDHNCKISDVEITVNSEEVKQYRDIFRKIEETNPATGDEFLKSLS